MQGSTRYVEARLSFRINWARGELETYRQIRYSVMSTVEVFLSVHKQPTNDIGSRVMDLSRWFTRSLYVVHFITLRELNPSLQSPKLKLLYFVAILTIQLEIFEVISSNFFLWKNFRFDLVNDLLTKSINQSQCDSSTAIVSVLFSLLSNRYYVTKERVKFNIKI